ncbi:MAG TPA: aldo/keto reductase [Gammaproteobacteria bacterium]|nr:aldo/keto reductase [Gammaproteobacteria bacterium]HAK52374.1 aldo/keto reductase [Gammaproteobacteria bacterium]|tara:strand:- start:190 stop:1080 length:891 start_codon:yes stop_codon:yes gene_type:complete
MIEKIPFGSTGHLSSRILFGAAALGSMSQEKADTILPQLLDAGINHIDTAAGYGDSELRIAPWMAAHRDDFFLASKTGDRTYDTAKASIERSITRLQVDRLDLIQFHNLTDDEGWATAMGANGALKAAVEAREQGLVRFIGVTGHGTRVAEMHLKSLNEFDFDSVLLPYNHMMMQDPVYAEEFEALYQRCHDNQIAMQTIKSVARRRWREDDTSQRYSWYEPIRMEDKLSRAVQWVLSKPGIFLNSSSDTTLLPVIIDAAQTSTNERTDELESQIATDCEDLAAEPLFVRGVSDSV